MIILAVGLFYPKNKMSELDFLQYLVDIKKKLYLNDMSA